MKVRGGGGDTYVPGTVEETVPNPTSPSVSSSPLDTVGGAVCVGRDQFHIHPSTHTSIHPFTHTSIHPFTHTSIHSYIHTPIHSYIHSLIHPFTHTSIHPYINTPIHPYINTSIHAFPSSTTHHRVVEYVESKLRFGTWGLTVSHNFLPRSAPSRCLLTLYQTKL